MGAGAGLWGESREIPPRPTGSSGEAVSSPFACLAGSGIPQIIICAAGTRFAQKDGRAGRGPLLSSRAIPSPPRERKHTPPFRPTRWREGPPTPEIGAPMRDRRARWRRRRRWAASLAALGAVLGPAGGALAARHHRRGHRPDDLIGWQGEQARAGSTRVDRIRLNFTPRVLRYRESTIIDREEPGFVPDSVRRAEPRAEGHVGQVVRAARWSTWRGRAAPRRRVDEGAESDDVRRRRLDRRLRRR